MTLKTSDVQCSKVYRDRNALGSLFVFTREVATQIIPLTEDGQFDTSVKTRFLDYLAGLRQMSRITADRNYIRENGKINCLVSIIPGTKITIVTTIAATEVFKPCPEKLRMRCSRFCNG